MREHLKTKNVDCNVTVIEVAHDSFAAFVKRRCNDYDLMTLVQRIFVQIMTETLAEISSKATPRCKPTIDPCDVVCFKILNPTCIIQCLSDDLSWRAVPFQFDKHQCTVRSYGEQIYAATEASIFLPSNQHPLV